MDFICAQLRALIAFAAFTLAGLTSPAFADSETAALRAWKTGGKPSFALRDVDGTEFHLTAWRGHIILLHFFATWCEPCREELPALNRLAERGRSRKISVVAISVAEVPDRIRRFFEKEQLALNFPVLLDQDRATAKTWGVQILPSTIVLDAKLSPRLMVARDYAWDNLDISRLLARLQTRSAASIPSRKI